MMVELVPDAMGRKQIMLGYEDEERWWSWEEPYLSGIGPTLDVERGLLQSTAAETPS